MSKALLCAALTGLFSAGVARAADTREARVDAVFANYARKDVPGCAVGISEAGRVVFARGYGMADLAWAVPISPDTRFDIASEAKQFTAFAVALLAERGKLSLDDDLRIHVPEVREMGHKVTLRHMLGMRSGLPDFLSIASVTGRRGGFKLTPEIGLGIIRDIPALDFAPGTDWTYSNTNYFLLGLVVERISKQSLADFLKSNAFAPANMQNTLYQPDPQPLVTRRATPYAPSPTGFLISPYPSSDGGAKGVQSTVLDMLAWAEALDSGRLAGTKLAEVMRAPGRLTTGEPLTYGMGLESWVYRGSPIILHGGTGTGHRAQTLRFPKLGVAISLLCNRSDAKHDDLTRSVADAWLAERLEPLPPATPFGPRHRAAVGDYINDRGLIFELRMRADHATAEGLTGEPLRADGPASFAFETGQRPARLVIQEDGTVILTPGQGRVVTYRKLEATRPAPSLLGEYAGRYQSHHFNSGLTFTVGEGELRVLTPGGLVQTLRPTTVDRFMTGRTTAFTFKRRADGFDQLIISTPRAHKIVYERVR